MARGILRGVVGSYLSRDPATMRAIGQLKDGALAMAEAIESRNDGAVVECLREYWSLKRSIDPGACGPAIEAMVAPLQRDLVAWELPGAGGGGFLLLIAKDGRAAARVRAQLRSHPAHALARSVNMAIDDQGLTVSRG